MKKKRINKKKKNEPRDNMNEKIQRDEVFEIEIYLNTLMTMKLIQNLRRT